jgi:molybdate transport system permease protein
MQTIDYSAFYISLRTACLATVITFFLGIMAARYIASFRSNTWKALIDGLFTLPLVLPPTVIGFFLLFILGVNRPLGRLGLDVFGIKIVFSWSAAVIAAVVVSFPIMYRAARGAFEQVDLNLVYAARTLGLSEWRIFWRVIFPSALPGVAAGGVLAFARGMGEFGATAMIAGNIAGKTRTLPLAVYSAVAAGDMTSAYCYVAVIVIVSLIIIAVMNLLLSKYRTDNGRRRTS